jgi:alanyl-tRNA synthetase
MTDLLVTYPAGSTSESSVVTARTRVDGQVLLAVERTPCHPQSPRWPDQPEDRCALLSSEDEPVSVRALEGYLLKQELRVGAPTAEEEEAEEAQALPCVVHALPAELAPALGEQVTLQVQEDYRAALSRSHSRCHLVSLALNAALREAWRKEPPARDSLGNPDFDKLAIVSSKIDEHSSLDSYRVGKHLRKSGFSADVLSDTHRLAQAVVDIAGGWLLSNPQISLTPGECRLDERRTWACELPIGTASFPCGGTHPSAMEPDEGLEVEIGWDSEERSLKMLARSRTFHL